MKAEGVFQWGKYSLSRIFRGVAELAGGRMPGGSSAGEGRLGDGMER